MVTAKAQYNLGNAIAIREFESFAATRVRRRGANSDRVTGNVAAALFTNDTSRALDPHLHTHCVVFNATHDNTEQRSKALQNYEMLSARKNVEKGPDRVFVSIPGHDTWTFDDPLFRVLLLRGICWAAHAPEDRLTLLAAIGAEIIETQAASIDTATGP